MPSLLVIIFVLEVVSHLVNSIGAATINSLVSIFPLSPFVSHFVL